ncbi:MAG: tetratricopeptide repeat protein, partial [Crocosphaera sp.]
MKLIHSNKMSILYDIESVLAEVDLNVATVKQMKQGRERSSYRAVINWLTKYKFNSSATNLEKVKGLLEAFFHFCEVEDWTRAKKIIIFPLPLNNSTKTRIYLQLGSWGYYSEQTKLCKKMLNQIDAATDIIFFNALSITFMYLGEYDKIIDYSKKYLSIAEQINDEMSKGTAFCNIGLAYYLQGKYEEAIEKQNEYLVISKKIGEARHLANALGNLGLCYDGLKQYQKAIKSYHEQLDIARNNNLPQSEGNALGNIGLAYHHLGDYKTAIPYHQEYLTI